MPELTRTDARHNRDQLVAVAREAFAEHGTATSLRDVARRAGVGIGTLYRHFPTRQALIEAVLGHGFDRLREQAVALADDANPRDALLTWLRAFAESSARYRGLPESVLEALQDEESALHASCFGVRDSGRALLTAAQQAGAVRADLTIEELMSLAAGVAWAGAQSPTPNQTTRLLELVVSGLGPVPTSSAVNP
jgi:AcrR family transcriptional regulator